jgi:hypothetical protein
MSENGKPFFLSSIDLSISTTVSDTKFQNRVAIIREIQNGSGIYIHLA